jgi:PAS domain S-box-containing protein
MQLAPEFTGAMAAVRVLLIEDDPDFAALVRRCVAGLGALPMLTTAQTLEQAHEALRSTVYDLILADLGLPDSNGVATVHSIAQVSQRPIIVLTANEEPGIRDSSLAAGAYELLHKSDFDARVFTRLVRLAAIQGRTFHSLRESEARFRSLVELSSDYYWEQDAEHRVSYVSSEYEVAAGLPASAILGKRRWEYDVVNLGEAQWAAHRADLEARRTFRDFEMMRVDETGEARWVAISGEPVFTESGHFRGYRGIGRDITERKRAEEELLRFRAAVDESADMIVVIDRATMKYVDVNRTVCRLLGYSRSEMLSKGPQDLLPESRDALERTYDALIADASSETSGESSARTHYRCKDGSLLPLESTRRT